LDTNRRSNNAGTDRSAPSVRRSGERPATIEGERRACVLLGESDHGAGEVARATLEAAGYSVWTVRDREATGPSIELDPPDFALVDVGSDLAGTTELLARLAVAGVPFVLTATSEDATLIQRSIDAGAIGCFRKPVDVAILVPSIPVWMARAAQLVRFMERDRSMRAALQSSRHVGTAVGILMARYGIDAKRAFDSLRRGARDERISVRSLASRIVEGTAETCSRAREVGAR
jgi:two-component system, response regulator PdtaR